MPLPKPLNANQHRAIALLSLGMDMSSVAADCNITRGTLYRWKQCPEFQRSLTRQVGEMMGAVVEQIQNEARVLIAGGLDSANKLRQLVLDEYTPPSVKRHACNDILRCQGRFLDMLGFNAKVAEKRKLANEELRELDDADPGPENIPPQEPGNIDQAPESEQSPSHPLFFRHKPLIPEKFSRNPVDNNGNLISEQETEAAAALRSPGVPPGQISANSEPQPSAEEPAPTEPTSEAQSESNKPPRWQPPEHVRPCQNPACTSAEGEDEFAPCKCHADSELRPNSAALSKSQIYTPG
jgi:hypothetical protein